MTLILFIIIKQYLDAPHRSQQHDVMQQYASMLAVGLLQEIKSLLLSYCK